MKENEKRKWRDSGGDMEVERQTPLGDETKDIWIALVLVD